MSFQRVTTFEVEALCASIGEPKCFGVVYSMVIVMLSPHQNRQNKIATLVSVMIREISPLVMVKKVTEIGKNHEVEIWQGRFYQLPPPPPLCVAISLPTVSQGPPVDTGTPV